MKTAIFFFARLLFAWVAALLIVLILWSNVFNGRGQSVIFLVWLCFTAWELVTAANHLRRVKLVHGEVNASTLANRQRRQIEIPFPPAEAFAILEATVRELPRTEAIQSAADSLQLRARVARNNPYNPNTITSTKWWNRFLLDDDIEFDLISATISPRGDSGSVTLICEPDGAAWRDWFTVDNGVNLEHAEAICRAISRRIDERRHGERTSTQQTAAEKELAVAKLGLLHAQIEPHFLYNTLGSAKYLVARDPAAAERLLDNLILYLRHSLPRTEDTYSTLGDELERANAYLDILKIRMGDRLSTHISVADELKSIAFPTMMLQTLVENAIKHGLEPKSGGGNVWILAKRESEVLVVTVADDGCGMGHLAADANHTKVGLNNIRERLKLTYGSVAKFNLVANFPSGVAATIAVPLTMPARVSNTVPASVAATVPPTAPLTGGAHA